VLSISIAWTLVGCGQSPPELALTAKEREAVELARAFLEKSGTNWGNPKEVKHEQREFVPGKKGDYLVIYPTSAHELKVLGERAVVVDTSSGGAWFLPRD
jgi:hypothetical protein